MLFYQGYKYYRKRQTGAKVAWMCATHYKQGCLGRATTINTEIFTCPIFKNGLRGGIVLYYQGYKYHKDKEVGKKVRKLRWVCATHRKPSGCTGSVCTLDGQVVSTATKKIYPHNHPPIDNKTLERIRVSDLRNHYEIEEGTHTLFVLPEISPNYL
ncbi:uncharacterized protein LOC125241679 [Leguminivora glycinivorella]|uniref:uncharacterized protein LOC125241679 n=1 Tax=Leguminivora glycinivorella TaxID=1035111 RepID=UPI00200EB218|nr:uncharacterized protein LOC125241679 [Leguminivora glycinivorella]